MGFGRKQFSIGALMAFVATYALGFAFPGLPDGLIVLLLVPLNFLVLLTLIYCLLVVPCWMLLEFVGRGLEPKPTPGPPAGPAG